MPSVDLLDARTLMVPRRMQRVGYVYGRPRLRARGLVVLLWVAHAVGEGGAPRQARSGVSGL